MPNLILPSKVILLRETEVFLQFGRYNNGTIRLQALIADQTDVEYGGPFAVPTVNWEQNWQHGDYAKRFPFPAVVVKKYSENEGLVEDLEKAGVIEKGGAYLSGSDGKVEVRLLTKEWQAVATEHLKAEEELQEQTDSQREARADYEAMRHQERNQN